jgi:hypothetical protein
MSAMSAAPWYAAGPQCFAAQCCTVCRSACCKPSA